MKEAGAAGRADIGARPSGTHAAAGALTSPAPARSAARALPGQRIAAVDAARGCAMLMVCLSHIKHHLDVSAPLLHAFLTLSTRVATPTFLLLSGLVIGHLLRTSARRGVGLTLVDRGLFLLLVAHVLLGLAELPAMGPVRWLFGRATITDVIGIALFAAVLLRAASAAALAVLGASLCIASWIVAMTVSVEAEWARLLGALLFHIQSEGTPPIDAPLVPYLGVFLIGMALSARLQPALRARQDRLVARRLLLAGAGAITLVLVGVAAWHFGKDHLSSALGAPEITMILRQTLNPLSKWPPSPAYLLFYGGAGLLLTGWLFAGRPLAITAPLTRTAAVIGRASLMAFVVQDWLFFVLPKALRFEHLTSVAFWLAYLAAGILTLYALARAWDRARGNRFLTIGLRRLAASRRTAAVG